MVLTSFGIVCFLQPTVEKAQLQALHGDQLIQSNHYAVDSIRPKCVELRRVCDNFSNEAKKKNDILDKSLQIHTGITKVRRRQVFSLPRQVFGAFSEKLSIHRGSSSGVPGAWHHRMLMLARLTECLITTLRFTVG